MLIFHFHLKSLNMQEFLSYQNHSSQKVQFYFYLFNYLNANQLNARQFPGKIKPLHWIYLIPQMLNPSHFITIVVCLKLKVFLYYPEKFSIFHLMMEDHHWHCFLITLVLHSCLAFYLKVYLTFFNITNSCLNSKYYKFE